MKRVPTLARKLLLAVTKSYGLLGFIPIGTVLIWAPRDGFITVVTIIWVAVGFLIVIAGTCHGWFLRYGPQKNGLLRVLARPHRPD